MYKNFVIEGQGSTSQYLIDKLKSRINIGFYDAAKFIPPIRELAEEFQVATATIHKALKVLASEGLIISQPRHGYKINFSVKKNSLIKNIAFLSSTKSLEGQIESSFHKYFLFHFQKTLLSMGGSLLIINCDFLTSSQIKEQIVSSGCRGIIVNDLSIINELESFDSIGVPIIVVDAWSLNSKYDTVLQDGFVGGVKAARYLWEKGCRQVVWFGAKTSNKLQSLERFGGASSFMSSVNSDFFMKIHSSLGDPSEITKNCQKLIREVGKFDSIIVMWQELYEHLIAHMRDGGIAIGKNIEVIGWSTLEEYNEKRYIPNYCQTPMVIWSIEKMAKIVCGHLKSKLNDRNLDPILIKLEPELYLKGDKL